MTDLPDANLSQNSALQPPPDRPAHFYPSVRDRRHVDGVVFPEHHAKFRLPIRPGKIAFTIGSCFARNVEEELERQGLVVPPRAFAVPKSEYPHRPNGLLNEFTPPSMARRIGEALTGTASPLETLVGDEAETEDLLLPVGGAVTRVRALERRAEIAAIYARLSEADFVVLTLGYIEAWFDRKPGIYLNRMPMPRLRKAEPGRYEYRRLDLAATLAELRPAMESLQAIGAKVILTVSPVPIQRTFEPVDCVVANEYSKSVLRVAAEELRREFSHVDYYPSYEIVRTAGLSAYEADFVHVREDVVAQIVAHMIAAYSEDGDC